MKKKISLALLGFVMILASCKKEHADHEEYHSVTEKIEATSRVYKGDLSSEKYFADVKTMEVTEGGETFLIPERKSQIKSYACTECHSKSLAELQDKQVGKKAHWDIKLNHANENTMNCTTCHNGDNMDNLKSITNMPIDFNQSYKLCSQCHTKQFDDWAGGAHGKKMGGWAPPRASLTCVNCHNPHKPHFEKRWPMRYNQRKVELRK